VLTVPQPPGNHQEQQPSGETGSVVDEAVVEDANFEIVGIDVTGAAVTGASV